MQFKCAFIALFFCFSYCSSFSASTPKRSASSLSRTIAPIESPRRDAPAALSPSTHPTNRLYQGTSPPTRQNVALATHHRSLDEWEAGDIVVVATVNGSLHAYDRSTGSLKWTLDGDGPVVKATLLPQERSQVVGARDEEEEDITWIVEPVDDGTLYLFRSNSGLQKFPISIRQLVDSSPFAIPGDDKIFVGRRQTTLFAVDIESGNLLNVFGPGSWAGASSTQCNIDPLHNHGAEECGPHRLEGKQTLMIGRTDYMLTIHSGYQMLWNVTYSAWGPNNLDHDLLAQYNRALDDNYVTPLHDGTLIAYNARMEGERIKWYQELLTPTIAVFDTLKQTSRRRGEPYSFVLLPQPTDPYNRIQESEVLDRTFVNYTEGSGWYAMSEFHFPAIEAAPPASWSPGRLALSSLVGVHKQNIDDNRPSGYQLIEGPVSQAEYVASSSSPAELLIPEIEYDAGTWQPWKIWKFPRRWLLLFTAATVLGTVAFFNIQLSFRISPKQKAVPKVDAVPVHENESSKTPNGNDNRLAPSVVIQEPERAQIIGERGDEDGHSKRRKRGSRGGKSKSKKIDSREIAENVIQRIENVEEMKNQVKPDAIPIHSDSLTPTPDSNLMYKLGSLIINETQVLGTGSHGTVVVTGTFEGRPVAIKRMLLDFYEIASHEISLLQESDDHPNVIRYFCSQQSERFLFIALELCPASLQQVVDKPSEYPALVNCMEPSNILFQIASGVRYLHSLKIVHRDIKPHNILVAEAKKGGKEGEKPAARMLISDFGLCKKLDGDQSSFRATTAHAAGTSGWRAPELLMDDESPPENLETHTGSTSEPAIIDSLSNRRATRAIDIFSLGCVFYFFLSNGQHPFGDRYMREANIVHGKFSLRDLTNIESQDLIDRMISHEPRRRPTAAQVMVHPYFWSAEKQLNFLLEVSDRFEKEDREPPSPLLCLLESRGREVLHGDWHKQVDKLFLENLGKYRKYKEDKVLDLLRALRNKKHHYQELPDNAQRQIGTIPNGYLRYFTKRFEELLLYTYYIVEEHLQDELVFRPYFTL